jgi:8-oxo-dGTP pyrophosphatase MutT (NUDIX family)
MENLETLKRKLNADEPSAGRLRRASVAVTLKDPEAPSVLLIKRADREGDPWSGQIAFPGGKAQEGDNTLKETAIRETREEVSVNLEEDADFLGYFTPFRTHTGTLDVFPAVFLLRKDVEVRPNEEVSSYQWVKLRKLISERSSSTTGVDMGGQTRQTPALLVDGYAIWGLTHRIISSLLS